LTLVVNNVVAPTLIGLAVWTKAAPGRPSIVTYFAALIVVRAVTGSYAVHTFSGTIYTGELTDTLLRPHPAVLAQLGWEFGLRGFEMLFTLPIVATIALLAPGRVGSATIALALPALVLAAMSAFAFGFAVASSAFWTQRYFAVSDAAGRLLFLLGGEAAPIPLLPRWMRPWIAALPFRSMRGFPAEVASGLVHGRALMEGFALQIIWLAVLALAARGIWRAGVRRYTALGG
jgi:ABC-2 type transport system permease protein